MGGLCSKQSDSSDNFSRPGRVLGASSTSKQATGSAPVPQKISAGPGRTIGGGDGGSDPRSAAARAAEVTMPNWIFTFRFNNRPSSFSASLRTNTHCFTLYFALDVFNTHCSPLLLTAAFLFAVEKAVVHFRKLPTSLSYTCLRIGLMFANVGTSHAVLIGSARKTWKTACITESSKPERSSS